MLSKVATVVQCALLALNLIVMGLNIASPSLAALSARQFEKDSDFVRAVRRSSRNVG